jgi:hypothetical protein
MEWVLQVIDEFDDAVAALRHVLLGLHSEMGVLLFAGVGTGAVVAELALRAHPGMIGAAAITANLAALLKIRDSRAPHP